MNENTHYEYATAAFTAVNSNAAEEFNAECRKDALIQATLAVAYEQRTANLIAFARLQVAISDSDSVNISQIPAELWERI
jgi:hypothetical protein